MQVIFYKAKGSLFDKFIKWWTRGPYCHVEIVFSSKPICNSNTLSVLSGSSIIGTGVRINTMDINSENWDLMDIPWADSNISYEWFKQHEGQGYDYTGLFGLFSPIKNEYNHWFCSESCAASLRIPDPWRLDPNRLALLLRMMGGKWDTTFSSIAVNW